VPTRAGAEVPGVSALEYRLYSQMSGQLFTDGTLHRHEIAPKAAASGPATARKTVARKAPAKTSTPAGAVQGEKPAPRPRKPKTPKA
jgi:hypothetical protein